MNCPICNTYLEVIQDDYRQEWERVYYHCPECGNDPELLIVFHEQSSRVASEDWCYSEEKLEQLQDEYYSRGAM